MKKRIFSILLICCMVFSLFPVSALAANSDVPFTDVKTTDWFYDEVCYVYDEGLMQGTSATAFDPNGTTSRGMIVTILYRLEGEPSLMNANIFTDVEPGSWYEKAVVWANGKGIVEGYGNGKFGPDDSITREQLAAIMYRYANYKGYDVSEAADLSGFVDSGKISSYALNAMKWANAAELITGIGASQLDPQGDAARAQAAAIFYRFCGAFVTKDICKVTFDLNYENAGTYTAQNVKAGEKAVQPTELTRSGYTFAGWYTKDADGNKFDFGTAITADLTLYAHWTKNGGHTPYIQSTPTYTVTFDVQGHGTAPASQTIAKGGKVTEPTTPTEAGYTFGGWYREAACVNAWNFSTDTVKTNTALFAKWTANSHTITYKDAGDADFSGTHGDNHPTTHTYGTETTLVAPTKDGYTFGGWYATSDCTGTAVTTLGATAYTANITLYAKWTANAYAITYMDEGNTAFSGTHGANYPTTHTYGTETTLVNPTKTGYAFKGWFTTSDCTGAAVTSLSATDYTENITLYAKWVETKTITQLLGMLDTSFPTTEDFQNIPNNAWRTADGKQCVICGGNLVFKAENTTVYAYMSSSAEASGDDFVYSCSNYTITFHVTDNKIVSIEFNAIYQYDNDPSGIYTAPKSTVTFDLNGASGTVPEAQTIDYGGSVTKPTTDPTFANHTFGGWYKTKDATTGALSDPWDFDNDTVTGDMTLYAQWETTISTIIGTNANIPTSAVDVVTDWSEVPDAAWVTDGGNKAVWLPESKKFSMVNNESSVNTLNIDNSSSVKFIKCGDTYVLDAVVGTITCTMSDGIFTSMTFVGNDLSGTGGGDFTVFDGTYTAPAVPTFKAVYNTTSDANTLTFYYDSADHSGDNITVYEDGTANYLFDNSQSAFAKWGYDSIRTSVKGVVIDESVKDYTGLTSTAYMLQGMEYAESISGAEYLDVSNVTDMSCMFYNYGYYSTVLNTVPNVSGWKTGNVTSMGYMFYKYGYKSTGLTAVPDVSQWNTEHVTDMSGMFDYYGYSSTGLTAVPNVSGWNTEHVTDMSGMFDYYGYSSTGLTAVPNVSQWNTGNVTNMSSMFHYYGYKSTGLTAVPDVSQWNTGNVTDMSKMFFYYGNSSTVLTAVPDVSGWDTGNVTDLSQMFQNYGYKSTGLTAVPDVSGWNTEHVTNMSYMFTYYGYKSTVLNTVPDVSQWKTGNVTDLSRMFYYYGDSSTALNAVPDVSGWNTGNVTNMSYMFQKYGNKSTGLNFTLDLSKWSVAKVTSYNKMFDSAGQSTATWSVTIPAKTGEQANDSTHWYVGNGTDTGKYIEPVNGKAFTLDAPAAATFKAVYNTTGDANTLTFYYDSADHSGENITVYDNLPTAATQNSDWGYNSIRYSVKSVVIDSSVANYHGLTSTAYMFAGMYYGVGISGAEYLDISNVTNMMSTFMSYGSSSTALTTVPNVSGWNTAKVTNMSFMFQHYGSGSAGLNAVPDVSEWNTANVTNMSYMFNNYGKNSETLDAVPDVSGWNTSAVTNMSYMFSSYGSGYSSILTKVPDVSKWNTAKVTNMKNMFAEYGENSGALIFTLDLSGWSVASVTSYDNMFSDAGASTANWSVTIPAKTGTQANETTKWYVGGGTDAEKYVEPADDRTFTPDTRTFKAVYNTTDNALTFYYDAVDHSGEGTVYNDLPTAATSATNWGYNGIRGNVKSVVIDESAKNYNGLTSTAFMLFNMQNAENISGAEYLDVSNVTDMSYMFTQFGNKPTSFTAVPDVSEWNTGNVTNMSYMFYKYGYNSTALEKVPDVSKWDTSSVTKMSYMFGDYGYDSTELNAVPNVSEWNTGNVTDMNSMFSNYGGSALNAVPNVSNWNTGNVTNMNSMFNAYGKNSLVLDKVPDVSEWNTVNVTNMSSMFREYGSKALAAVPDVSKWNTGNVTNMSYMFDGYGKNSLVLDKVPDVSTWNTGKLTNMNSMFSAYGSLSTALSTVPAVNGWKTEYVTDLALMFKDYGSSSTKMEFNLNLSGWNITSVASYASVFENAGKSAPTWSVTIPAKTGELANDSTHWYVGNGEFLATDRTFTLAAPAIEFSVSATNKVTFSPGNLQATIGADGNPTAWKFAAHQYDYIGEGGANETIGVSSGDVDLFGWSTAATSYGINTSIDSTTYSGDFKDWGTAIGNGNEWRTLSKDEWTYLLSTRTVNGGTAEGKSYQRATINSDATGVYGLILYPDNYTAQTAATSYTSAEWQKMEAAGCVFLPTAGQRLASAVSEVASYGVYWSSSCADAVADADAEGKKAYYMIFATIAIMNGCNQRAYGNSVRLVKDVPAAE